MPQSMTGIILKLLPNICTGKLTYFKASYWHVLAKTLDKDTAMYFHLSNTSSNKDKKAQANLHLCTNLPEAWMSLFWGGS